MTDVRTEHAAQTADGTEQEQKYQGGDPYVFISYSHEDAHLFSYFDRLVNRFQKEGYRFWYDNNIGGGESWNKTMIDRVMHSRILIALLSDRYYESPWCIAELGTVLHERKAMVPLECETITTAANSGYQAAVRYNYHILQGNSFDRIFNAERLADCLLNDKKRTERLQEIREMPAEEKPEEQRILADTPAEAMSKELARREIDCMFSAHEIQIKPTVQIKRHFFSKPEKAFTPDEISGITEKLLLLLRERMNELRTVLFSFEFTGSRSAYKAALLTVKLVERMTEYYDFWDYDQNQKLHYFISDSAPLLRLMHCRALRNELLLSPAMISAVKNFISELDRLIDCIER